MRKKLRTSLTPKRTLEKEHNHHQNKREMYSRIWCFQ